MESENLQVRIAYMGSFLGLDEAEQFRQEFLDGFEKDISEGLLILIEDTITKINAHHVVRILAENAQLEFEFDEGN